MSRNQTRWDVAVAVSRLSSLRFVVMVFVVTLVLLFYRLDCLGPDDDQGLVRERVVLVKLHRVEKSENR